MIWVLIVLVALLIPILAIVLDSPVARSWARRLERTGGPTGHDADLLERLDQLEDDVENLNRALESSREDIQFLHRLHQNSAPPALLPPGTDVESPGTGEAPESDPGSRA